VVTWRRLAPGACSRGRTKNEILEALHYRSSRTRVGVLQHGFFADGFLFPVKELGFWTNPGHWVRVLDAAGSYMYFVL
jgi:hypothetical protein